VSRSHEMTTVRLWERTQRVSDDTTDLLLACLSETSGRLSRGQLARGSSCPSSAGAVTTAGSCSSSLKTHAERRM
jgi:hypothetical protein